MSGALGFGLLCSAANVALVCVAYTAKTYDHGQLRDTAWTTVRDNDGTRGYYGLREAYFTDGNSQKYSQCQSSDSLCDDCNYAGEHCERACIAAIIIALALVVLTIFRLSCDNPIWKFSHIIGSLGNFVALGIMLGVWYQQCMRHINGHNGDDDLFGGSSGTSIGPGYAAVIASVALNLFAFFINIVVPILIFVVGGAPPPTRFAYFSAV